MAESDRTAAHHRALAEHPAKHGRPGRTVGEGQARPWIVHRHRGNADDDIVLRPAGRSDRLAAHVDGLAEYPTSGERQARHRPLAGRAGRHRGRYQDGVEHPGQLQIMLVRGDGMQVGADKCRFIRS